VITATKITPGSVDDGNVFKEMIDIHQKNTEKAVDTMVADSKYGTTFFSAVIWGSRHIFLHLKRHSEALEDKRGYSPRRPLPISLTQTPLPALRARA